MAAPDKIPDHSVIMTSPWASQMKKPKVPPSPTNPSTNGSNQAMNRTKAPQNAQKSDNHDRLKVGKLHSKFDSPNITPEGSPPAGHKLYPKDNSCSSTPSVTGNETKQSIKPVKKCPKPPGFVSDGSGYMNTVGKSLPCPNSCGSDLGYVNRYVEAPPVKPIRKKNPPMMPDPELSVEDKEKLLQKVPAPAPRPRKLASALPHHSIRQHNNQDSNNNEPIVASFINRDSTGSSKSQDSGVGSASPQDDTDDTYMVMNDTLKKDTPIREKFNLKLPVPVLHKDQASCDLDGYEKVDDADYENNQNAHVLAKHGNLAPPLPLKTRRKSDVDDLKISSSSRYHAYDHVPTTFNNANTVGDLHNSDVPPLPPRSPTIRRRESIDTAGQYSGSKKANDSVYPNTVVPAPNPHANTPMQEKKTKKKLLGLEVPAPVSSTRGQHKLSPHTPVSAPGDVDDFPQQPPPPPPIDRQKKLSYISPEEIESIHSTSAVQRKDSHRSYLMLQDEWEPFSDPKVREARPLPTLREALPLPTLRDLAPDPDDTEDWDKESDYYSFLSDEPLYQVYHSNMVAREIVQQSSEGAAEHRKSGAVDDDDMYMYMDTDSVKLQVKDLLSRSDYDYLPLNKTSSLQDMVKLGSGTRKLWCEMPEVKSSGVLGTLSPEDKRLQEALFEVITSEASYVKSINLLVNHFLNESQLNPENIRYSVISKHHHHFLFSNIRQVLKVCARFLHKLEALWNADCVLDVVVLANTIADYAAKHFKIYVGYVTNMMYQERTYKELTQTNVDFTQLLERLQAHPDIQGLSLQSFLVLPMQRITRLPLLVDSICHRIPAHHHAFDAINSCLHVLQKIVRQCNEGARQLSNIEQVAHISSQLEFCKNVKSIAIVSQHRSLVKQGQVTRILTQTSGFFSRKTMQIHLFLFNDLLVVTKKKSADMYQVLEYAPRIAIHADLILEEDIPKWLPKGAPSSCGHIFVMALMEKDVKFLLACDSMSERTRWVEAVTPAQQITDDERIYDDWDCPQVQAVQKYVAIQPDELSLQESDIVNVTRKMADGWYQGERIRDGEKGWFPSNVTIEIQSAHIRAKNLRQHYRLMHGHSDKK